MLEESAYPMRVAFVLAEFPVRGETFIRRELAALASQGLDAVVFALRKGKGAEAGGIGSWRTYYRPSLAWPDLWLAQLHWLTHRPGAYVLAALQVLMGCLLRPRVLLAAAHNFPAAAYFAWAAQHEGVGRIHAHFAYVPAIVANVAARLSGAAFSFTAHAWDIYAERTMLRENIAAADRVVTCTRYNRETLRRLAPWASGKLRLNYHGLPLDSYRAPKRLKDTPPLILCVGRLVEKKGHRYLISACEALKRRGLEFRCRLVGDGPLRGQIESVIRQRALGDVVEVAGLADEAEVLGHYARASALVCPSVIARDGDRDGIPNVILEAMACRVPVVATDVSGIPEVVEDGATGLLVPPRDADALADAIERTLADPAAAAERADRARRKIERDFDVCRNAAELGEWLFGPLRGSGAQWAHTSPFVEAAEDPYGPTASVAKLYEIAKRVLDVAISAVALVALSPLLALIAAAVRHGSPGPIFFAHDRVGRHGRRFRILKFRTMRCDSNAYAPTPRDDHDPRLTKIGRYLRNHGLDELPQLINVLKGDMSLVGPRPEMPHIVQRYNAVQRRRLCVPQGITGLWQVEAPHDVPIHEHIEFDLQYIERRSLMFDFGLMVRTVPILFGRRRKRKHGGVKRKA